MNITVDENMPYAATLFGRLGDVTSVPGRPLPEASLLHADALMVRSVTSVNAALLSNTPVRFVGTATAGVDHVDTQWLEDKGIAFSSAPGCNAIAVVEYVISALLTLAERDHFQLQEKTVGIVGVGQVGGRLQARLNALGVKTLLCDPPRADREDEGEFWSLDHLVRHADILSFHTPLTRGGKYNSYHLMGAEQLAALPEHCILINAGRGAVVDNQALLHVLKQGKKLRVVLDVWEPEPDISLLLLARVDLASPHIAGYSLEGKARGTTQVFEAYTRFLGQPQTIPLSTLLPAAQFNAVTVRGALDQAGLKRLIHLVYDVRRDDANLRAVADHPGEFDRLRKYYPERREWSSLQVACDDENTATLLRQLGFSVSLY